MELQIKNDNPKGQTLQQKQNKHKYYVYTWYIIVYIYSKSELTKQGLMIESWTKSCK